MRFARIVERGNRQVLLTTTTAPEGDSYIVLVETQYDGDQFVSIAAGDYATRQIAYENMMALSDDEVIQTITNILDSLSEDLV